MRRLKIAINSLMLWSCPTDQAVRLAAHYGFSGIEVWMEHVRFFDTPITSIAAAVKDGHQRLTIHGPSWDINLCALNQNIRQQSLKELRTAIEVAAELQASDLTIHPGRASLPEPYQKLSLDIMVDSLAQLADYANNLGVILSIELMEPVKGELITEPHQLNALIEKLPYPMKTTLDVAHLQSEADFPFYFESLHHISKIHFSNRSHTQYHLPLATGIFNCHRLLKEVLPTGIPVIIEGFDNSPDHSLVRATLAFLQADSDLQTLLMEV